MGSRVATRCEDVGSNFDGAPALEFRIAGKALELEQSGLSYQRIPPDYRFPYGHTHKEQEEVLCSARPTLAGTLGRTWRVGEAGGLTERRSRQS